VSGRVPDQRVRLVAGRQRWQDVAFLHWRCDPRAVRALLPAGLDVDVVDGSAWLGVTPFRMRDARLPGMPPPPGYGAFLEVNARTYVRHPASGTDGIWFFSLLCARRLLVAALRGLGLPYVPADGAALTRPGATAYLAAGRDGATFEAEVRPGERLRRPDPWAVSVTGRWNAYTVRAGRPWRVPVEHPPWPLFAAEPARLRTDLPERCGVAAGPPDLRVLWSPGVDVRLGVPRPA
jgi:uncharacterized protein YqjF (DUF2071 family)